MGPLRGPQNPGPRLAAAERKVPANQAQNALEVVNDFTVKEGWMRGLVRRPTFEDAIARLLSEAEAATDRVERLDRLRRAAQMYDVQVGDGEKAFAVWQAAFT